MRRKIFFVTLVFIITNVTNSCDNKSDEKCYFQVVSTSTDRNAEEETNNNSAIDQNWSEASSEIYSSTDFSSSINIDQNNIFETSTLDVTESTQQETETTSFKDLTTLPSTESTIQDITTDETEPVKNCELNNTSYAVDGSNILNISWELKHLELCNNSFVSIVLINQDCCDNDSCLCNQKIEHKAVDLNYYFSEPLIPCTNYSYQIKLNNSSDMQIDQNIMTDSLNYLQPKELILINITDTTFTFNVILNDPENKCQDKEYSVECKSSLDETKYNISTTDIVVIENLEPQQNYSCSARVKHGKTEWSEYSDASIFTTNAPDCNIHNVTHEIHNQMNILSLFWETNGSDMCNTSFVSLNLTSRTCVEQCNEGCACNQSFRLEANRLSYNFSEPLIPCVTYFYQIGIINSSTTSSSTFNATFDADRKYGEIENFIITDEEEFVNNTTVLNMVVTWDYKNVECKETFVVSAKGQGNNYESSIQGYRHKFQKLDACEKFDISIHISNQTNVSNAGTHTMKRIIPSEIQSLTLSQEEDKTLIKIAWTAPEYGAKCIDQYIIRVKNESEITTKTIYVSSTIYLLTEVDACANYSITVSINTSTINEENLTTSTTRIIETTTFSSSISPAKQEITELSKHGYIKTEPRPFAPPQVPLFHGHTEKSLTFNVVPSNELKNKCPISMYHVECTSNEVVNIGNKTMSGSSPGQLVEVDKLEPFHNYACKAAIENEKKERSIWSYNSTFMTNEGSPTAPSIDVVQGTITATSFIIKWKEPTSPNGIIKQYHVYIKFVKFEYDNPSYCTEAVTGENKTLLVEDLNKSYLSYNFTSGKPFSTYTVQIRASNQAFDGEFSSHQGYTTKAASPDKLRNFIINKNEIKPNETYNKAILIEFNYPCRANGRIKEFVIEFKSSKILFNKTIKYDILEKKEKYSLKIDELEPDISYVIYGYALGEENIKGDVISENIKLNPGIPEPSSHMQISFESTSSSIYVSIPENLFDSSVGKIINAKIFIQQWNCSDMTYRKNGLIDDERLSNKLFWGKAIKELCIPEYDTGITIENKNEKPLLEGIGTDTYCEPDSLCNGRLRPGTTYGFTFRLYTTTGYADTIYFKISTNKEVPIVAISIIILSILCLVFLIGFYISCRRTQELRKSALDSPYDRKDISIQNFVSYHVIMSKSDNEKMKEEHNAIRYFSKTLDRTFIASRANEKLNRYINIYPYDSTRVVLNDDEFENDYINASYINGYYYPKEYIAAQGPKQETVLDFWRMVIQHQTESIVMLTSLVENNKVKCHEYFPRLNGRLKSGNITITCVKEQNFPSYIKRVLNVEKNDMKLSVNHYYFCKWPDHGCPNNALDLIEFVKIVRNERQKPGETFIAHCSAGVGRTGTFIAVDIMMQRLKKEAKINIFDLVKQLRSQRMEMVQSCDQYVFLYTAALELINLSRRTNVIQNLRDTVLKFVNELEIPESWKRRDNPPNEQPNIVNKDQKETIM